MIANIEVNGSQVQLQGSASEIADVIRGLGRSSAGGRKPGRPAKASTTKGRRGARSKYDEAGKRAIVAASSQVRRGGLPQFLREKGISYGTLANWRSMFKKKRS